MAQSFNLFTFSELASCFSNSWILSFKWRSFSVKEKCPDISPSELDTLFLSWNISLFASPALFFSSLTLSSRELQTLCEISNSIFNFSTCFCSVSSVPSLHLSLCSVVWHCNSNSTRDATFLTSAVFLFVIPCRCEILFSVSALFDCFQQFKDCDSRVCPPDPARDSWKVWKRYSLLGPNQESVYRNYGLTSTLAKC